MKENTSRSRYLTFARLESWNSLTVNGSQEDTLSQMKKREQMLLNEKREWEVVTRKQFMPRNELICNLM